MSDILKRIKSLGSDITCPLCGETDFDAIGLKGHIRNGWCEVYEATPLTDAALAALLAEAHIK